MKTIETKYHGATNTRGSRISATDCGDHRISISYDDSLSESDGANHRKAAEALCAKLGWTGRMVSGATKTGYVFVFCPELEEAIASLNCVVSDPGAYADAAILRSRLLEINSIARYGIERAS